MNDISDEEFINVPIEDQEYFQKFWINLSNFYLIKPTSSISETLKNIKFIDKNSRKRFTFKLKKN